MAGHLRIYQVFALRQKSAVDAMSVWLLAVCWGLLLDVGSCKRSEDITSDHELMSINWLPGRHRHQPQRRSTWNRPEEIDEVTVLGDNGRESLFAGADPQKRGSLFRFGKRGSILRFGKRGSIFRFGKRGSIFRFGKRGSILRFGKRQGNLFRFGKRDGSKMADDCDGCGDVPFENSVDNKLTLFRIGQTSDVDLMRDSLARYRDIKSSRDGTSRDEAGSLHWGSDLDQK